MCVRLVLTRMEQCRWCVRLLLTGTEQCRWCVRLVLTRMEQCKWCVRLVDVSQHGTRPILGTGIGTVSNKGSRHVRD